MSGMNKANYDTIVSVVEGDEDAIAYVIAIKMPRVKAVIRRLAGQLPEQIREDCFQDVLMLLLEELRKRKFKI